MIAPLRKMVTGSEPKDVSTNGNAKELECAKEVLVKSDGAAVIAVAQTWDHSIIMMRMEMSSGTSAKEALGTINNEYYQNNLESEMRYI